LANPETPPPVVTSDQAARLRALARLLDSAVQLPGTNVRFGLDAALGLIPGVGDLAGAALSGYIVLAAARMGVPAPVLARMLGNIAVDGMVGAIPLLGDLFDVGFRANLRNAALIERHVAAPGAVRSASWAIVSAVVIGVIVLAAGGVALTAVVLHAIISRLG
jgi:hypothetical protein